MVHFMVLVARPCSALVEDGVPIVNADPVMWEPLWEQGKGSKEVEAVVVVKVEDPEAVVVRCMI